ncbi:MAG: 16S rRNA (cytosine(1402)-N(4))-methyltransferase RsmH [Proteobacteria bacterium]|nr:16S rRNA (cytosine(1402)-N(4))-methyltransferase RsmH [Pseudomonadota bacterium]
MANFEHLSVLRKELVDSLSLQSGDYAVDCTAGGGGHTLGLLQKVGLSGKVLAFDRDDRAQAVFKQKFETELKSGQLELIKAPFSELRDELSKRGLLGRIRGLCADIGVSSPQIDTAERGFSFTKPGPLDMRMDQSQGMTAADLVNNSSEEELVRVFRDYGEDPKARSITRAILRRREIQPFHETTDLASVVAAACHYRERSRKHPATKVFQALRIAVNAELDELQSLLASIQPTLALGGRCAIISFHSLEDRLVKHHFKQLVDGNKPNYSRDVPLTALQLERMHHKTFQIIKPFPLEPSAEELEINPRARSAKLRIIEKLPGESGISS